MNIVELSNASRYESESSGSTSWANRTFGKASSSGLATLLFACGFLLLLASQWFPMVSATINPATFNSDEFGAPLKSGNMADAQLIMQIPYYLVWLVVFVLLGALLFAPPTRRQVFFGAGAGALGVQTLIVLPILRKPLFLLDGNPAEPMTGITTHYQSGTFFLVAAFVALAAAMVVAVRGRILPVAYANGSVPDAAPDTPDVAAPRPSMHDALAESVPDHGQADADIEFGWSSRRAEVVDVYELAEPVEQAAGGDHDHLPQAGEQPGRLVRHMAHRDMEMIPPRPAGTLTNRD